MTERKQLYQALYALGWSHGVGGWFAPGERKGIDIVAAAQAIRWPLAVKPVGRWNRKRPKTDIASSGQIP